MAHKGTEQSQEISKEDQLSLPDAIKASAVAVNLCLSNKFFTAQARLEPWARESMYHALGYSTIMFLQAIMTFEQQTIAQACDNIKVALEVCERQRRKVSWTESVTSWFWNPSYDDLTEEQRHAELCYAECLLQRAILTFIQDENLVSFIKGALKIRSCYHSYKTCLEMVTHEQLATTCTEGPMNKKDFEGGVHLGIGSFNLLLSMLPGRIVKILEWVGFSGDKHLGLKHLAEGCENDSLRSPLCAMVLLAHHSIITYYLGIGEGDVVCAEEVLQPFLKAFPKGAIFLYYAGRIKQVQGKLDEAIVEYQKSIDVQTEWKQFHHICFWEMMWCYSFKCDWAKAYYYADILCQESRWSKTTYMYMKGACICMAKLLNQEIAQKNEKDDEEYIFKHVPDFKQRIAGKSIPFEKFSVHKANKYFQQNKWLFLPGLELIYLWNGFRIMQELPDTAHSLLLLIERCLDDLEETKNNNPNYTDDWCLGKLLQGMCLRCVNNTDKALQCFLAAMQCSKELVSDTYLAPHACAEVGFLYMDNYKDLTQAKEYLKQARKDYDGYMLQNRLHFKIHAALQEIKHRQKQNNMGTKLDVAGKYQEFESGSVGELRVDGASLHDSKSSFETAPKDSSDDDCRAEDVGSRNATVCLSNKGPSTPNNICMETSV